MIDGVSRLVTVVCLCVQVSNSKPARCRIYFNTETHFDMFSILGSVINVTGNKNNETKHFYFVLLLHNFNVNFG
jgi:hypothetical protein